MFIWFCEQLGKKKKKKGQDCKNTADQEEMHVLGKQMCFYLKQTKPTTVYLKDSFFFFFNK